MPNFPAARGSIVKARTGGFICSWVYKQTATETAPNHVGIQYGMNPGKQSNSIGSSGFAMGCNLRQRSAENERKQ